MSPHSDIRPDIVQNCILLGFWSHVFVMANPWPWRDRWLWTISFYLCRAECCVEVGDSTLPCGESRLRQRHTFQPDSTGPVAALWYSGSHKEAVPHRCNIPGVSHWGRGITAHSRTSVLERSRNNTAETGGILSIDRRLGLFVLYYLCAGSTFHSLLSCQYDIVDYVMLSAQLHLSKNGYVSNKHLFCWEPRSHGGQLGRSKPGLSVQPMSLL